MDKMQMAHDYAMKCVGNPNSALNTNNQIVSFAWQYADAMQAEAEGRNKTERPKVLFDVEREGQHFDDIEEAKREGEYFFKLFCRQNGIDDSESLRERPHGL